MKYIGEDFKKIYQTEHLMLILMAINFLAATALVIFGLTHLSPAGSVVKVGYGDIAGYRDGSWADMLAFPLLGFTLGVLHNFVALKIYHKRGAGMTKFFLITTTTIIAGAFIVLIRLLQEG